MLIRARIGVTALTLAWMSLSGCSRPILTARDAIAHPDQRVRLVAYLEEGPDQGSRRDLPGHRVTFLVDDKEVGWAVTDEDGQASCKCRLPRSDVTTFRARTEVDETSLTSTAPVYRFAPDRVIVVVDIDDTLSDTEARGLVLGDRDRESKPILGSQTTLLELAADYELAYLTARPRMLLDRTRRWLIEHQYPNAPLFVAPEVRDTMWPGHFKYKVLRELQGEWPNTLIGIGDRESDSEAYGANGMLTIIVGQEPDDDFGRHALMPQDWRVVQTLFEVNHATFSAPDALRSALRTGGLISTVLAPYEGDVP